jgi:hypothetical protein
MLEFYRELNCADKCTFLSAGRKVLVFEQIAFTEPNKTKAATTVRVLLGMQGSCIFALDLIRGCKGSKVLNKSAHVSTACTLKSNRLVKLCIGCRGTATAGCAPSDGIAVVIGHSKPSHCFPIGAMLAVEHCPDRKEEEHTTPVKYARLHCNGHLGFSSGGGRRVVRLICIHPIAGVFSQVRLHPHPTIAGDIEAQQRVGSCTVSSVFGRNLQCEPVKKVENQWHPRL